MDNVVCVCVCETQLLLNQDRKSFSQILTAGRVSDLLYSPHSQCRKRLYCAFREIHESQVNSLISGMNENQIRQMKKAAVV